MPAKVPAKNAEWMPFRLNELGKGKNVQIKPKSEEDRTALIPNCV